MKQRVKEGVRRAYAYVRNVRLSDVMTMLKGQPRYWLRIMRHTLRLFMDNRGPYQANTLAYRTMVSLVPMLAFIVSFAFFMGNDVDFTAKLKELLASYLPAEFVHGDAAGMSILEEMFSFINRFQEKAGQSAVIGFIFLLLTSAFLINAIEATFNNIWHVERRRPLAWRILAYIAMTMLIPVMFGLSIYMTAQLQVTRVGESLGLLPFVQWTWYKIVELGLPLAIMWVLFMAMYKWLPNTKVETGSAMLTSFIVALSFEAVKWSFSIFAARMVVSRQYWWGSLGIFLVFLIWLYVIWWLVLFGAQFLYVFQNYRYLFLKGHVLEGRLGEAYLSLKIMLEIAQRHMTDQRGPTVRELAEKLEVDVPHIQKILGRLIDKGAVVLGTVVDKRGYDEIYVPGKDLGSLTLAETLRKSTDFWEMAPDPEFMEIEAGERKPASPETDSPEHRLDRLILEGRSRMEKVLDVPLRDLVLGNIEVPDHYVPDLKTRIKNNRKKTD